MGIEILNGEDEVVKTIIADTDFADRHYPGQWREAVEEAPSDTQATPETRLTRLQFRSRFTHQEKVGIYQAAEQAVEVRVFIDDVHASEYVDLDNPDVIAGVQGLADAGLITPGRANEILGMQRPEGVETEEETE